MVKNVDRDHVVTEERPCRDFDSDQGSSGFGGMIMPCGGGFPDLLVRGVCLSDVNALR